MQKFFIKLKKRLRGHDSFSKGFTLVEVLVALSLFSLTLAITSYIIILNLRSGALIRNNFIASGLVQEGMEAVRSMRDRDWIIGNPFGTSIADGTYLVQWNSLALIPLGANPNLKKDPATGIFSYDSGNDTIFKRTVGISTVVAGVEKKITVTINWTERGGALKSVSAEEHLFNWK